MPAPASPPPAASPTPLPVQPVPAPFETPAPPPVVELRPSPEPAVALPTLELAAAPRAQAALPAALVRVLVRLSNGERIEVGAHADETAARAEATALMRFLRETGGDWPFLNGRFVRPDAIVSVDIVAG